ncbi:MAG: hypothetical protein ACOC6P_01750 [Candidatus Aminicenantaceae bacterium]
MKNKNIHIKKARRFVSLVLFFLFVCLSGLAQAEQESPEPIKANKSIQFDFLEEEEKGWEEGRFEVEVHYSNWTLNWIKGLLENTLNQELGDAIQDEIIRQIENRGFSVVQSDFENELVFDSSGSNYGLEVRLYPRGREGSFSLGISIEKTDMNISIVGTVKQEFNDSSYAEIEAEGYLTLSPISSNLSFRWDFIPQGRITPYFVCGLGLAPLKGEVSYNYTGGYYWGGPEEIIKDSDAKSFKEIEEEIEFNIPNIMILLQTCVGVRGEIMPFLHARVEAGFWDGFVIRGGLAYRF